MVCLHTDCFATHTQAHFVANLLLIFKYIYIYQIAETRVCTFMYYFKSIESQLQKERKNERRKQSRHWGIKMLVVTTLMFGIHVYTETDAIWIELDWYTIQQNIENHIHNCAPQHMSWTVRMHMNRWHNEQFIRKIWQCDRSKILELLKYCFLIAKILLILLFNWEQRWLHSVAGSAWRKKGEKKTESHT